MRKPLQRHPGLIPVSRDHHFSLLFCWKLKMGLKKGLEAERLWDYIDWFFSHRLGDHFAYEEAHLFTLLNPDSQMLKSLYTQHRAIRQLILEGERQEKSIQKIIRLLTDHIRYEEREVFRILQQEGKEEALVALEQHPLELSMVEYEDEFWL